MNSVVVYRRREAIGDSFMGSGNGGGSVDDDFSRRLGNIENDVAELKAEVRSISATIPHLATKADLKAEIGSLRAEIAGVRTEIATQIGSVRAEITGVRTEVATQIGSVRTEIADVKTTVAKVETQLASMETALIKWIIATVLTATGLTSGIAFSIAKFVH